MGVPSLFREVVTKYKKTHFWKDDFKVDYFFWDFNGVIYETVAKMPNKYNSSNNSKYEDKIINNVINETCRILKEVVKPNKMIYIAIDGPAPKAKMIQQRWRRYKTIKLNNFRKNLYNKYSLPIEKQWDTRKISPGTNFMLKLNKKIEEKCKSGDFLPNKNVKIIFSSSNVPGEAEHKFLNIIRTTDFTNADNICIFSKDGDLIPLSLALPKKNIYILRPVGSQDTYLNGYENSKMCYLSIDEYRKAHIELLGFNNINNYNEYNIILDYIFILSLGGNDFVQPINFLRIKDKGLDKLLRTYKEIRTQHNDYLIIFDEGKIKLNTTFFIDFINKLHTLEGFILKKMRNSWDGMKNRGISEKQLLNEEGMSDVEIELSRYEHMYIFMEEHPLYNEYKNDYKELDFKKPMKEWKEKYYKLVFGFDNNSSNKNEQMELICKKYMESLLFTIKYYIEGVPSWEYFYSFTAAPLLSDFYNYINKIDDLNIFDYPIGKPYKPFGRKYIYSEPKLPIIDDKVLLPIIKKNESKFTDIEKKRNILKNNPIEFVINKL